MTIREAIRELEQHQRPGYSIICRKRHDGVQHMATTYLLSHKARPVGAIVVFRDGSHLKAQDPWEARDWFEADA